MASVATTRRILVMHFHTTCKCLRSNGSSGNHWTETARPGNTADVSKVSRETLAERLAAVSHETWMRQARRHQGAVNPPAEVTERDFERAEDTIRELELLGIVDFAPRRRPSLGRLGRPGAVAMVVVGLAVAAVGNHVGNGVMTVVGVIGALIGIVASA